MGQIAINTTCIWSSNTSSLVRAVRGGVGQNSWFKGACAWHTGSRCFRGGCIGRGVLEGLM